MWTATDFLAFVKAAAVLEDSVGRMGMGSTTLLERVFQWTEDKRDDVDYSALLDWVLANTVSYDYYGGRSKRLKKFIDDL